MDISKSDADDFQDHLEKVLLLTSQYPQQTARIDQGELLTRFSVDHAADVGFSLMSSSSMSELITKRATVIRDYNIIEIMPSDIGSKLQAITLEPLHWTQIAQDMKNNAYVPRDMLEREWELYALWFTNMDREGVPKAAHLPVRFVNGNWRIAYDPRFKIIDIAGAEFRLNCDEMKPHIDSMCKVLCGAARFLPKRWRVLCSATDGSPRVSLTTDAIGARSVLQFRDLPPGKSRREAIVHWVREHYRQLRNDPETETMVRKHLRGGTSFRQFGINFEVSPSSEDVAENLVSGIERQALRSIRLGDYRKDRRKKLLKRTGKP